MVKKSLSFWDRLLIRIDNWAERKHLSWREIVENEIKPDQKEIERARRVILDHQYLMYLAEANIQARKNWMEMLEERANQTSILNGTDQAPQARTLELVRTQGSYAYPGGTGRQ